MKYLFMDSNVWLSLYHFSDNDLKQFKSLKKMLKTEIVLVVPQQIVNEIERNRESKLFESRKKFEFKAPQFPVYCQEYDQYKTFSENFKELKKSFADWLKIIDEDIENNNLPADRLIKFLLELSEIIECDSVQEKAILRFEKGDPPGKDKSYGDSINWECLLKHVPENNDLYFISNDKDFKSLINLERFNPFLKKEWENIKSSEIHFYNKLQTFLEENIKEIQLRDEKTKEFLITQLLLSSSFNETHAIIAKLNTYTGWSEEQRESILRALKYNDQVSLIAQDKDVRDFYKNFVNE